MIHGPDTLSYDIGRLKNSTPIFEMTKNTADIGPVILTDYFHKDYFSIVEQIETTNVNNAVRKFLSFV